MGLTIFILDKGLLLSGSSFPIGLVHIKTKSLNDLLDETFLGHKDMTSGHVTVELYSQEARSIAFLFQLDFLSAKALPKFVDVLFLGAPEKQIVDIDNADDPSANEETRVKLGLFQSTLLKFLNEIEPEGTRRLT